MKTDLEIPREYVKDLDQAFCTLTNHWLDNKVPEIMIELSISSSAIKKLTEAVEILKTFGDKDSQKTINETAFSIESVQHSCSFLLSTLRTIGVACA